MGDFFVNGLVDVGENAQLHQIGDDLERLLLELLGEFAHDDRRLDDDDLRIGGQRENFGAAGLRPALRRALLAAAGVSPRAGLAAGPGGRGRRAAANVAAPDKFGRCPGPPGATAAAV